MTSNMEVVSGLRLVAARFLLLAGFLALPAEANNCQYVNCIQHCSLDRPESYKPQMCDKCCPASEKISPGGSTTASLTNDRLAALEKSVGELQVMTGVLLGLVVLLLLLLAVAALFLQNSKTLADFHLPVFFRKNKSHVQEKKPHKSSKGVDPNSTVIKMPKSQSNRSPASKRASGQMEEGTGGVHDLQPRPFRTRQPSESTCPEESSEMPDHAYDNLALSTSTIHTNTLHNTSNSSTDTLGPALSINTLETTLPSGNHLSTHGGTTRV